MFKDSLLQKAERLLFQEFEASLKVVKNNPYHASFVKEKIRHSLQVLGTGNGILAHEPYFKDKSSDFISKARVAILLHDVYRFREAVGWFQTGKKIDHGVLGASLLEETADFNDILITIPVKHHGHMIEALYEDKFYQNLDDQTRDMVKHIAFAVRDADKIANWQIVTNEFDHMRRIWFPYPDNVSFSKGTINEQLWSYFLNDQILPGYNSQTNADIIINLICWLFDINYLYSIDYSIKLNLFQKLCNLLTTFKVNQQQIKIVAKHIERYLLTRFQKEIKIS